MQNVVIEGSLGIAADVTIKGLPDYFFYTKAQVIGWSEEEVAAVGRNEAPAERAAALEAAVEAATSSLFCLQVEAAPC